MKIKSVKPVMMVESIPVEVLVFSNFRGQDQKVEYQISPDTKNIYIFLNHERIEIYRRNFPFWFIHSRLSCLHDYVWGK